MFRINRILR